MADFAVEVMLFIFEERNIILYAKKSLLKTCRVVLARVLEFVSYNSTLVTHMKT